MTTLMGDQFYVFVLRIFDYIFTDIMKYGQLRLCFEISKRKTT